MGKASKVVICGMRGVGKTAILEQLIFGNVNNKSNLYPTIEDIYTANIETDRGTKERLYFYDTAGVSSHFVENSSPSNGCGLQRHYTVFGDGYVLVYDTSKPESLDVLFQIHKDIERNKDKKDAVIIVIGNRTGQPSPSLSENTITKAANWCTREKMRHFEVNAMDRSSLYDAFVFLTTRLNPAPTKSSFPQLPALTKLTQKNSNRPDL